jgi:hypothetical protein
VVAGCCDWGMVIGWSGCLLARGMVAGEGCLVMLWRSECAEVRRVGMDIGFEAMLLRLFALIET